MKKDQLIQDWLDKELSTEEKLQVEEVIEFTERLKVPDFGNSKEEAWSDLITKIESKPSDNLRVLQPNGTKKTPWLWLVAAAIIALVAVFGYLNKGEKLTTYTASDGELATIVLPDNSTVTLNAGSTLSFKEKDFEKNRWVTLSGEAFFDVEHGEAFKVLGNHSHITVLGTSFNVYSRSNQLKVSVFTGKVQVESRGNSVIIEKEEEAQLIEGGLAVSEFNLNQTATWREGNFYFNSEPLNNVVEELERQFEIEIEVKSEIGQRFYSGFFSKTNMKEALQLVFVPMGLSIQTDGNQVIVE